MKRTLPLTALFVCLWSISTHAATDAPEPGGFTTGAGRGIVSPALQLPVNVKPPVLCSTETHGTIALDGKTHLCICDGHDWKLANANTDEACAWAGR
jgi:hypothetical protein